MKHIAARITTRSCRIEEESGPEGTNFHISHKNRLEKNRKKNPQPQQTMPGAWITYQNVRKHKMDFTEKFSGRSGNTARPQNNVMVQILKKFPKKLSSPTAAPKHLLLHPTVFYMSQAIEPRKNHAPISHHQNTHKSHVSYRIAMGYKPNRPHLNNLSFDMV